MRLALSATLSIVGFCQAAPAANFPPVNDGRVMFAAVSNEVALSDQIHEPFGLQYVRAPEGPLWVKFRDLKSHVMADLEALNHCRDGLDKCRSPPAIHYLGIIDKARGFLTIQVVRPSGMSGMAQSARSMMSASRPL